MNTNSCDNQRLPVPEPREVIGLTASFSGIAAMLVLATLAPHPAVPATPVAATSVSLEVSGHAVGV